LFFEVLKLPLSLVPQLLIAYAAGASLVALLSHVGITIFSKAAFVTAQVIPLLDSSIPEDDQRNTAVIVDLVGNGASQAVGRCSDMFETVTLITVGSMLAATELLPVSHFTMAEPARYLTLPLAMVAGGVICAGLGLLVAPFGPKLQRQTAFILGFFQSTSSSTTTATNQSSDTATLTPSLLRAAREERHGSLAVNGPLNGASSLSLYRPTSPAQSTTASGIMDVPLSERDGSAYQAAGPSQSVSGQRHFSSASSSYPALQESLQDPYAPLRWGLLTTLATAAVLIPLLMFIFLFHPSAPLAWLYLSLSAYAGLLFVVVLMAAGEFYAYDREESVRALVAASEGGTESVLMTGTTLGLAAPAMASLLLLLLVLLSYGAGASSGLSPSETSRAGWYGLAIASTATLFPAAFLLALGCFSPIATTAYAMSVMSSGGEEVRALLDRLDETGKFVGSLAGSYAIAPACLGALLWVRAFCSVPFSSVEDLVGHVSSASTASSVTLNLSLTSLGGLGGAVLAAPLVFLFASLTLRGARAAAVECMQEVERQMEEMPGIMEWRVRPEYFLCASRTCQAALRALLFPCAIPLLAPLGVGLSFRLLGEAVSQPWQGTEAAGVYCLLSILVGTTLAIAATLGGSVLQAARKVVQQTADDRSSSLVARDASKAGDTIGRLFKDTAAPSLLNMMKFQVVILVLVGPLLYSWS
jgi:Na+/H+-translocating membrane pyrophosphatase